MGRVDPAPARAIEGQQEVAVTNEDPIVGRLLDGPIGDLTAMVGHAVGLDQGFAGRQRIHGQPEQGPAQQQGDEGPRHDECCSVGTEREGHAESHANRGNWLLNARRGEAFAPMIKEIAMRLSVIHAAFAGALAVVVR